VRGAGLSLLTYTVNEPGRALELFAWGVDSVISDRPDAILAAMTK
jgi:glycerophosphoryl diester phosphodiesterase